MLLHFWTIDDMADDVYAVAEATIGGRSSEVGLYIEAAVLKDYALSELEHYLAPANLGRYDQLARAAFDHDTVYVPYFVAFHLEELVEAMAEKGITNHASFLAQLVIRGIGCHIEASGQLVFSLDYTIDKELSDEFLVAYMTADGQLLQLSHES